ncbi:aminopeptidase N [Mangrovicella endophytica]|uniref:aminopeptidase N n=1 Tax=Mangrovicella endophytica TaxID=2066697 RepID=UPI000C9E185B|nr:aminopeptidase N [Mangrovicella endophytica]
MLDTDQGQTVRLDDYRPTDFLIHLVDMTVRLFEGRAEIETRLTLERRTGTAPDAPLVLDGDELTLERLELDGTPVAADCYEASPDHLTVSGLPESGHFTLSIGTAIVPENNTKLMGLYRSNGIWCTQCEAEGFRRITYFLDRPDVLATYRVRLEADRRAAPILLSNGNPGETGDLGNGRHFAVWNDPFPKPSYLFALVAGALDVLKEPFETMSGREVELAVYTERGMASRATYAMDALKRSMRWDERRFGREYDLDVFSIVAISDFNMGAMENKGLNIFNHKYVLLDPDVATDGDYAGVETVIAHEYFHNWTGNRITCRNWFQLCLKEGLTVYRDQEFSADERSPTVKRISSVRTLKALQFPEDQGPLQHPVRPSQYREINNFYTATVYDKGAEVVRMIATVLGRDAFRRGMDLYFDRHDGEAATIEDFILCFEEAGGVDLTQFALWYHQAGTPTVSVSESYDPDTRRLTLSLRQELAAGAAGTGTAPMHIPLRFGLVGSNGEDMDATAEAGAEVEGDVIHLREPEETVVFGGLAERPLVSMLRDFSAPVTLKMDQSEADRLALARLDPNAFNRWRVLTDLIGGALQEASRNAQSGGQIRFDPLITDAVIAAAADDGFDPSFRAQILSLPGESEIARMLGENVDPDAVHTARTLLDRTIGEKGRTVFERLRQEFATGGAFSPDAESAGRRAISNVALDFLSTVDGPAAASRQYAGARNMTDRMAAFSILVHRFGHEPEARVAVSDFFERYSTDELVLDKWFTIQATAPHGETVETVNVLMSHPAFTLKNPNRARTLIGAFAAANQVAFHRADGAGHRFVADRLLELDAINPQIAARIATSFRSWRSLEPARRESARETLAKLSEDKALSVDLRDIVDRSLR